MDGRKRREDKKKESRKGMEYVGKGKKVKDWKGMEERRKASKDRICVERLGTGKRGVRKWMRTEGSG